MRRAAIPIGPKGPPTAAIQIGPNDPPTAAMAIGPKGPPAQVHMEPDSVACALAERMMNAGMASIL